MTPHTIILVLVLIATVLTTSSPQALATSDPPINAAVEASDERIGTQRVESMKPTIVLVHGVFADAAGWNDVLLKLLKQGYRVHSWANPLRGLITDAAHLRDHLSTVKRAGRPGRPLLRRRSAH